jgi:L,D-transpeptidase YcbB
VIGRARKLKTPLLSSEIDTVIFRPFWNVPRNIQRNELVRDIERDPSYIAKNDFELVTPQDIAVAQDPDSDKMLAQLRSGKLRLRQRPGPKNALGLVKFVFPNKYNVYMHDTPAKSLFARVRRDFSHGCIRLAKSRGLSGVGAAPGIRLAAGAHRGGDAGARIQCGESQEPNPRGDDIRDCRGA